MASNREISSQLVRDVSTALKVKPVAVQSLLERGTTLQDVIDVADVRKIAPATAVILLNSDVTLEELRAPVLDARVVDALIECGGEDGQAAVDREASRTDEGTVTGKIARVKAEQDRQQEQLSGILGSIQQSQLTNAYSFLVKAAIPTLCGGVHLAETRKEGGLKPAELGFSTNYVSRVETGKTTASKGYVEALIAARGDTLGRREIADLWRKAHASNAEILASKRTPVERLDESLRGGHLLWYTRAAGGFEQADIQGISAELVSLLENGKVPAYRRHVDLYVALREEGGNPLSPGEELALRKGVYASNGAILSKRRPAVDDKRRGGNAHGECG